MNILLTGGTGFIGSYVLIELVEAGHSVTVLARNPDKVPELRKLAGVRFVQAELADHERLRAAVPGHDAVVHVALGWGDQADTMLQHDTLPSLILMEAARAADVEQFLYTSSTAAIGEMEPLCRTGIRLRPTDNYGATKASTENFLRALSHQSPVRANIIRPGYTFGNPVVPGASIEGDKRFREIVSNASRGLTVEVTRHDGTQFIWAGDLAQLYRAVLESDDNRATYHGLATDFVTWESIARTAISLTGDRSELKVVDKGHDPKPCLFDVSDHEKRFGLRFTGKDKIETHLLHLIGLQEADQS